MQHHDTTGATVHSIHWSTCVEDRTAIDATVRFTDGAEVDVTLLPAEDGRYRWEAWGDVTCWLSEPDAVHPDEWRELEAIVHSAAVAAGFEPVRGAREEAEAEAREAAEPTYVGYIRQEDGLVTVYERAMIDLGGDQRAVGEPEQLAGWPTPYMRAVESSDGSRAGYVGCDEHGRLIPSTEAWGS